MAATPDALLVLASASVGQWEVNLEPWKVQGHSLPLCFLLQSAWKPCVKMGHKELAR